MGESRGKNLRAPLLSGLKPEVLAFIDSRFADADIDASEDSEVDENEDEDEVDGEVTNYMLKPYAGENLSDLLRTVASIDTTVASDLQGLLGEDALDDAVKSLLSYMALGQHSYRDALRDLKDKLEFPENYGFEYTDHASRSSDRMVQLRDPRATNEVVLILDANAVGSYVGQVQDIIRDSVRVKFLGGVGGESSADVAEPYVVHVGDTHSVALSYSEYDDSVTQTVTRDVTLPCRICAIDVTRGVLVSCKLPNKKLFREWVDLSAVSGFAIPAENF